MRSPDTSPEAHRVQIEVYRRMTPNQRVRLAVESLVPELADTLAA